MDQLEDIIVHLSHDCLLFETFPVERRCQGYKRTSKLNVQANPERKAKQISAQARMNSLRESRGITETVIHNGKSWIGIMHNASLRQVA